MSGMRPAEREADAAAVVLDLRPEDARVVREGHPVLQRDDLLDATSSPPARRRPCATLRSASVLMRRRLPDVGDADDHRAHRLPGPRAGLARARRTARRRARVSSAAALRCIADRPRPLRARRSPRSAEPRRASTSGSARSLLPSTFMHGFCRGASVTTGFSLAPGMRASSTSMMTSCDGIASAIACRALSCDPGTTGWARAFS